MLNDKKLMVVPAHNTASALRRTVDEIPREIVYEVILTDDASRDLTFDLDLGLELGLITSAMSTTAATAAIRKPVALDRGAEIVVMLHPDCLYIPKLVPPRPR